MIERLLHGARGASTILWRSSHMIGVCRKSVAGKLAINLRAALLRVLELFDNGNARAFADDETITVTIDGNGKIVARDHKGVR